MNVLCKIMMVVLCAICMTGCMTTRYGVKMDSCNINQIKKGVTTKSDIISLLGNPTNVVHMEDGEEALIYESYNEKAKSALADFFFGIGEDAGINVKETKRLTVVLNKDGIVKDYMLDTLSNEYVRDSYPPRTPSTTSSYHYRPEASSRYNRY